MFLERNDRLNRGISAFHLGSFSIFQGFSSEVQVVANLLAIDGTNLPDVIALNAASASLAFSNIPWNGPVGAVRVGHTPESGFIVNPTRHELTNRSS